MCVFREYRTGFVTFDPIQVNNPYVPKLLRDDTVATSVAQFLYKSEIPDDVFDDLISISISRI